MKKFYVIIFLFIASLFSFGQTTINLQPSQDNTMYQDAPLNSNGMGINFFSGNNALNAPRRALLKFNLSSIPSNATITGVSLRLTTNKVAQPSAFNIGLHRVMQNWGEGNSNAGDTRDGDGAPAELNDATWPCSFANGSGGCITAWTLPGGQYTATASAVIPVGNLGNFTWSSAQMVADVQNWLADPSSNFGWILIGDETQAGTAKRFSSRNEGNESARPVLTIIYNSTLPVNLVFFRGKENKYGNLLQWQTSQEINNDFFTIEHSKDGRSFSTLTQINGRINSSGISDYNFIHTEISATHNYYRLAQHDIGGQKTYSGIVYVKNKNIPSVILIKPNPVNDRIILTTNGYSGFTYIIYTRHGSAMQSGKITGNSILFPGKLIRGTYYLRIVKNDHSIVTGSFISL